MPSTATTVGALSLPVDRGDVDSPIVDPTVDVLRDYLATWLAEMLTPKVASMTAPPVPNACPPENRYSHSVALMVQEFNVPALFVWSDTAAETVGLTTMISGRKRTLNAMYVFDRVQGLDGIARYRGLLNAVDATFSRAADRGAHPEFATPGHSPGSHITTMLSLYSIDYLGGTSGFLTELPGASARSFADTSGARAKTTAILSGYPAFRASFAVVENIGLDCAEFPGDLRRDLNTSIKVGIAEPGVEHVGHYDRIVVAAPTVTDV